MVRFRLPHPILRFQSTPPARGATLPLVLSLVRLTNFNPRPPRGGRHIMREVERNILLFQSTPPARGATLKRRFNIDLPGISIHAPREGGDRPTTTREIPRTNFNPRPPRGGRPHAVSSTYETEHFNPRPPRGGRLGSIPAPASNFKISIHAPREGGDSTAGSVTGTAYKFQSTPPARGATYHARSGTQYFIISIHAPREGGDPTIYYAYAVVAGISIHAPREGGDVSRLFDKLR